MNTDIKHKLIIIDDHPFLREGVANFIKANENFEIIGEFGDIRSIINSTFTIKPDVIILDLNLNGIDSRNSCSILKQRFPNCRILAYTQYDGSAKELSLLGFDGYVNKSEKDLLIEALLSILQGRQYFNSSKKIMPVIAEHAPKDLFQKITQLTARENEIAKYIVRDFSNKEIANEIYIAEDTVKTHRKHIYQKLEAKNKRELLAILRKYFK